MRGGADVEMNQILTASRVSVRLECERAQSVDVGHQESQHLQQVHAALFPPRNPSQWKVDLLSAG